MPAPPPDRDRIAKFLNLLYGDFDWTDDDHAMAVWGGRGRPTKWAASCEQAVAYLAELGARGDVWFGVCLQSLSEMRTTAGQRADAEGLEGDAKDRRVAWSRGFSATAAVVPGIWLDVDYGEEGHAKDNLPPTPQEALDIVTALPHKPSIVIHTGGGFHAYWLFREPFLVEDPNERLVVEAINRGWNDHARKLAKESGYSLDGTWDLARVLRAPGTPNMKHGGALVEVAANGSARYNPSDFDEWAASVDDLARSREPSTAGVVVLPGDVRCALEADAQPNAEMLKVMLDMHPTFKATWTRTRDKDLPSQSEYDLSLASLAEKSGWDDEEIVKLLICHRRNGGQDLKLDRADYYANTLARVKRSNVRNGVARSLAERAEGPTNAAELVEREDDGSGDTHEDVPPADAPDNRAGLLRQLSIMLQMPVEHIHRFPTTNVEDREGWAIVIDGVPVDLGGIEGLTRSGRFRDRVASVTRKLVPRMKDAQWEPLVVAMLDAAEDVELGADSELGEVIRETIVKYLASRRPSTDVAEAARAGTPAITANGTPVLFVEDLVLWMSPRGMRWGQQRLVREMKAAGAKPVRLRYEEEMEGGAIKEHRPRGWACPWARGRFEEAMGDLTA